MGRGAVLLAFPFAVVMTVQGDEGNVSVVAHAERLGVLYSNLQALFLRHYPQVASRRTESSLHFEYDTRVFLVHRVLKTGEWQEAREELGPNRHGILCDIGVVQGLYQGAAVVAPGLHAGSEPYFRTLSGHEAAPKAGCLHRGAPQLSGRNVERIPEGVPSTRWGLLGEREVSRRTTMHLSAFPMAYGRRGPRR